MLTESRKFIVARIRELQPAIINPQIARTSVVQMDHQATEALRVQSHQLAHADHGNSLAGGPLPPSITADSSAEGVSGFCRAFAFAIGGDPSVARPHGQRSAVTLGKRAATRVEASRELRMKAVEEHKAQPHFESFREGRPSKRDRRLLGRLRGRM